MNLKSIYEKINIDYKKENPTVLDIGAGAFEASIFLQKNGFLVTAIDIKDQEIPEGVIFKQVSLEEYQPEQNFDLVHARNVLPFIDDRLHQIERMLSFGAYVFFTVFGPNDDWKDQNRTNTKEEILDILNNKASIIYFGEEEYDGFTMKGDKKHWHIYTFFVRKND